MVGERSSHGPRVAPYEEASRWAKALGHGRPKARNWELLGYELGKAKDIF